MPGGARFIHPGDIKRLILNEYWADFQGFRAYFHPLYACVIR